MTALGPRPFGWAPRWWSVQRADGSVVEVAEADILTVKIEDGESLATALEAVRTRAHSIKVVNHIAANMRARLLHQADIVERRHCR